MVKSCCKQLVAAALLAGLIVAAAPASGGTIGISGNKLIAGAEPADGPIVLTVSSTGTELVLEGVDFAVVTPGCTAGLLTVTCALSGFTSLVIIGGDGDDAISLAGIASPVTFAITVLGGAGNDTILGSVGPDALFGGAGDDNLIGDVGDVLSGGPGDDFPLGPDPDIPDPIETPLPKQSVPAPGGLALLAGGLGAMLFARGKKKVQKNQISADKQS